MIGLKRDENGNIYDPLAKDLDNDVISDRYDHDFKDSDYLETTYDSPKTGDYTNLFGFIALLCISGAGLVETLLWRKYHKN